MYVGVLLHSRFGSRAASIVTGFYKFTCTFAKLKFGGIFKSVSARAVQVKL
jgi:hypothetical protein